MDTLYMHWTPKNASWNTSAHIQDHSVYEFHWIYYTYNIFWIYKHNGVIVENKSFLVFSYHNSLHV